jgi:sugar lactone lactonase YvrE
MNNGDQAFVESNNILYLYNGTGWYKIATVENTQPTAISGVESTYALADDGTATIITAISTDPDGFPLTWSYSVTSGSLGTTATVSQTDNVFTITPSTDTANAGEFSITFSVTDGATGIVSTVSDFTLAFGLNISLASYDDVSFNVTDQDSTALGLCFNPNGTRMYMLGWNTDAIYQYNLSTAFDLSTAFYSNSSFNVASQSGTSPTGIIFNNDGTRMYIGSIANSRIYQYNLSSAFNISTASYSNTNLYTYFQDTQPYDIAFNSDGTKMYMAGQQFASIYQYTLSIGFDLSTASYDSVSFSVASQGTNPYSLLFSTDGTKMFVIGAATDTIHQYSLSTAFDLTTASYDDLSFSVASQATIPTAMAFNTDETKMFMLDAGNDTIYQYSTGL